jgi:copper chaperone CopZ
MQRSATSKQALLILSLFICSKALAAEPPIALSKAAEPPPAASSSHYDKNALHRVDLRIVGKSCPICLLNIKKKVNALTGVVKADVMLKKPYGVSVIYDAKQVKSDKIVETVKSYEKNTFVEDVHDAAVSKVPLVLIPPFTNSEGAPH